MRAGWWWIDRWRKSTAYTDMTLAEQGAYRNLLDELWLRDGVLPKNDRILGKIAGDAVEWPSVRGVVLARFYETPEGYRNKTHDEVMAGTFRFKEAQREKGRLRAAQATRGPGGAFQPSQPDTSRDTSQDTSRNTSRGTSLPSPSPYKKKSPPYPPKGGAGYSSDFEAWWAGYPRKVGKGAAWRAWRRIKDRPPVEDLVAAVQRAAASSAWQKEGGQYIPHPATWLNQRRWEDEVEPLPKRKPPPMARVPAGHPCHGRREGESWETDGGVANTISMGWWWTRAPGEQAVKREVVS